MRKEVKEKPKYAVVAAVQLASVTDVEFEASLAELRDLAKTLGFEITATFTQKRPSFDTTAYLGVGKRQEIRAFVDNEPVELERTPQQDRPCRRCRGASRTRGGAMRAVPRLRRDERDAVKGLCERFGQVIQTK